MTDSVVTTSLWLPACDAACRKAPVRLFCVPYAGGGAQWFRDWSTAPVGGVATCPLELPGRGTRFGERPRESLSELAAEIAAALEPHLDGPFGLFGHSMGALLAYEVLRVLRRAGAPAPSWLFVSGHRAPHLPPDDEPIGRLPDDDLLERLGRLGGTPEDVLGNRELMVALLPALRADLIAADDYEYRPEDALSCPIVAFGGLHDPLVRPTAIDPWRQHTTSSFTMTMLGGGHFFVHSKGPAILAQAAQLLRAT